MKGHMLEQVNYEKDLGIIIDNELKFHVQTSAAVKKANQILGIIKRTIATKNEKTIPLLYDISMVSSRTRECSVGSTLQRRSTTSGEGSKKSYEKDIKLEKFVIRLKTSPLKSAIFAPQETTR